MDAAKKPEESTEEANNT
jgi:cysteine dioxygenase